MALSEPLDKIQKEILTIHRSLFQESPTPMKLQKLCYYAQGFALAEGKELFEEDFQAWQHGPVIFDLYTKHRDYQWRQINEEFKELVSENNSFLTDIVGAYGRFDGAALSTMTHREAPWLTARNGLEESEGCNEIISKESLKDFFGSMLRANETE